MGCFLGFMAVLVKNGRSGEVFSCRSIHWGEAFGEREIKVRQAHLCQIRVIELSLFMSENLKSNPSLTVFERHPDVQFEYTSN